MDIKPLTKGLSDLNPLSTTQKMSKIKTLGNLEKFSLMRLTRDFPQIGIFSTFRLKKFLNSAIY
jgi:hypothetical protein